MSVQGPNDLLNKINSLQQKQVPNVTSSSKSEDADFGAVLDGVFKDVNDLQGKAQNSVEKFLSGETKDVDQVMNKVAEAGVAFDLMLEVKNKVMEAYKQMERMQV